jgi:16S rRNA (cytosine1402-N4)-methyltransferase
VSLVNKNFRQLDEALGELGVKWIDAALFDLGLSSDQLETSGRGFSFQDDEPLAMSFGDPSVPGRLTAKEIVNHWREESLADVIYGYGEETFARRIAKAIVAARRHAPLETTSQLVEVIRGAVPGWYTHRRLNPATKTFQALRIATNDELGALREALPKVWESLAPGGRLAIISFHSLEARILKEQFRLWVASGAGKLIAKKPILPSREEAVANPRSRSAQLRLIQKQ